jgi:uncharacterized protein YukE
VGQKSWQSVPGSVQYKPLPGAGQSADPAFAAKPGNPRQKVPPPNYPVPANWPEPEVTGQNLGVDTGALTTGAHSLGSMADELSKAVGPNGYFTQPARFAAQGVGTWPAATQLASAIEKTATGVNEFVTQLQKAHDEVAQTLMSNASNYHNAETANVSAIQAAASASSGWKIQAGGVTQHVDPTYGDNLSPQTQAMVAHLTGEQGPQQVWNGSYNITVKSVNQYGVSTTAPVPFKTDNSYQTMNYQTINNLIQATNPEAVSSAADAYGKLVGTLTGITGQLADTGSKLADQWSGATAVSAISNVQMLHQTATDLQANAYQAGEALRYYSQVLPAFRANPVSLPPQQAPQGVESRLVGPPPPNVGQANTQAQAMMAALNGHIETSYNAMPSQLNKNLPSPAPKSPDLGRTGPSGTVGGSVGGGVGPGGPGGSGPGGGVPVTGVPPVGRVTTPTSPVTTVPPGTPTPVTTTTPGTPTTLAGVTPPSVTSPGTPGGVTGVGTPGGVGGAGGVGGVGSVGLPGGISPGSVDGLTGSTGGVGSALDNGAGADDVGVTGADGVDGVGLPGEGGSGFGFPGMGGMGGGGAGGQDRARQAWESEDAGVWDPEEEGLTADAPGLGADGMIGADGLPGGLIGADGLSGGWGTTAGVGAGDGFGAGGGFGGSGGFGGGSSGAGADDGMGFPMMGGGSGGRRDGSERQRQAWMEEDADIWGDDDSRVPPVIG